MTRQANVESLVPVLTTRLLFFRSRAALQVEILALRHQIGVLQRSAKKRPKLTVADRVFAVKSKSAEISVTLNKVTQHPCYGIWEVSILGVE